MRRDANSSSEVMGQEMRLLDQSATAPPILTNLTGFVREAIQNVNPQRRTFLGPCTPRRHFSRNAPLRIASPALLETTPPRSGSAPPGGRLGLSCLPDDCDTIEPGFPVRQRDGHASRRESSACFSITRPAATRNSSAGRSRSSPTHRARVASNRIPAWSARRRSSRT